MLPCEAADERPVEELRLTEDALLTDEARLTELAPVVEEERVADALERTLARPAVVALRVAPEVRVAATERARELLTVGFTVGRAAPPRAGK